MGTTYREIIKRFADGRDICNCGEAYYTNCGVGILNGEHRTDMPACQYGCSANLIAAKNEIVERLVSDQKLC